jgi:hypothetical protein
MSSIFVWTFHDAFALIFLAIIALIVLVAFICSWWQSLWSKITHKFDRNDGKSIMGHSNMKQPLKSQKDDTPVIFFEGRSYFGNSAVALSTLLKRIENFENYITVRKEKADNNGFKDTGLTSYSQAITDVYCKFHSIFSGKEDPKDPVMPLTYIVKGLYPKIKGKDAPTENKEVS